MRRLAAETFAAHLDWTLGHTILPMSSAPAYRGDPSRANPEQLFVGALSACQAVTSAVEIEPAFNTRAAAGSAAADAARR